MSSKILIEVYGGVVQSITSDDSECLIMVLDHDNFKNGDVYEPEWICPDSVLSEKEIHDYVQQEIEKYMQ